MYGNQVEGSGSNYTTEDKIVCVGRDNTGMTSHPMQWLAPRQLDEKITIVPSFMTLKCPQFGGCMSPNCEYATKESPIHFYGLFDGYKCSEVVDYYGRNLSDLIAEEWGKEVDCCLWRDRWENAISRAVAAIESEFEHLPDKPTMLVAIVSPCQVVLCNDGYSMAFLFRGATSCPLLDHQVNPTPHNVIPQGYLEVSTTSRDEDDEFLLLATDGLLKSVSVDEILNSLNRETIQAYRNGNGPHMRANETPAQRVAGHVMGRVLRTPCDENISVIGIDLKCQEG